MSGQILVAIFAVLVLGIFIGSNLGVLLMCVLHMGKKADMLNDRLLCVYVEKNAQEPQ